MDDTTLVLAARRGEEKAFAAVYDGYADHIYDFSYSTLRDETAATEVTRDTFLVAFDRMDQLRQPDRLRAWLYAIAHHCALRRLGDPSPRLDGPEDLTLAVAAIGTRSPSPKSQRSRAELAEFVWDAASALNPRDRALLDLHLRQGLAGDDLADAVGSTATHVGVTLGRLQAQVERSLGALLVARTNERNCASLAGILAGWDGRLTPALRAAVTRHVDDCETCNTRRRIALNPLALLSAAPLVRAPARLRQAVLDPAECSASHVGDGWSFEQDGFPDRDGDRRVELPATGPTPIVPPLATDPPPTAYALAPRPAPPGSTDGPDAASTPPHRPPGRQWSPMSPAPSISYGPAGSPPLGPPPGTSRPPPPGRSATSKPAGLLIGTLAGLIILVGGITAFLATGHSNKHRNAPVAVTPTTSGIAPGTTTLPAPTSTTGPSTTVSQGRFIIGATTVDFGATDAQQSLDLSNKGSSPVDFTASSSNALLTVAPTSGRLAPGENETLSLSLDRGHAPAGVFAAVIALTGGPATAEINVTASVGSPPAISSVKLSPLVVVTNTCPFRQGPTPPTATVTVTVTAPAPLRGVVLQWGGSPSGSQDMTGNGSTFTGTLGPFSSPGQVMWSIIATDSNGLTTTSPQAALTVRQCP